MTALPGLSMIRQNLGQPHPGGPQAAIVITMSTSAAATAQPASISRQEWGTTAEGAVDRYLLSNGRGMRVGLLTYGGILQSLEVPDRHGDPANVVLGFDRLQGYLDNPGPYFGALIGRYGNRIAEGRFTLDPDSHRQDPPRVRHPARLPPAHTQRVTPARRRPPAAVRGRLRPQLGARPAG